MLGLPAAVGGVWTLIDKIREVTAAPTFELVVASKDPTPGPVEVYAVPRQPLRPVGYLRQGQQVRVDCTIKVQLGYEGVSTVLARISENDALRGRWVAVEELLWLNGESATSHISELPECVA